MRRLSWRTRWRIYEYVRNSLWIVPGLFFALAMVMGFLVPEVDERTTFHIGLSFGPAAASSILGAVAGGMITFTGFVFSILLLAVQFGSSQFSPRMLRRFLRDSTTKVALGVFIATFIYALMVLRTLGLSGDARFVPDNAIAVVLMLLLLSMVMFLRLISKTTQGLRVAAVVKDLGREGAKVIRQVFPEQVADGGGAEGDAERPVARPSRAVDYRHEPGVLQSIDAKGLVRMARDADVVLELVPAVGDLVAPGEALFRIYGEGHADEERLRRSIAVGDERTMRQDPAFVLRLLADISAKALSPGVNDPTTSVQALDQIDLLLRLLAHRKLTPGELRDGAGEVRVLYPTRSWEDYLSIGLDETRNFGASSQQVARRLRALLDDLRETVPACRRPAIEAQLALLESSVRTSYSDPAERRIAATDDRQGLGGSRPER